MFPSLRAPPTISKAVQNSFLELIYRGQLPLVERMLDEYGPCLAVVDNNQPIIVAARGGHVEILERLMQVPGVDVTVDEQYVLVEAARCGNLPIVHRLLQEPSVDPTARDNEALCTAASNGHLEVVHRLLLAPHVNPAAQQNQALRSAAAAGHELVVERLLREPLVDPADHDNGALCAACSEGCLSIVSRLLCHVAVCPTAVAQAALNGHSHVVARLLLEPEVDVEVLFIRTPFHEYPARIQRMLRAHLTRVCHRIGYALNSHEWPEFLSEIVSGYVWGEELAERTINESKQMRIFLDQLRRVVFE